MKVYIAGPMTGIPQFNIPAFDDAANELRGLAYEVVNPAELDSPEMRRAALESRDGEYEALKKATGETWGDVLSRDVKWLSDAGIEAIVLLPNWYMSRGATLEATVGMLNNLRFFLYRPNGKNGLLPVSHHYVLDLIGSGFRTRWAKQ